MNLRSMSDADVRLEIAALDETATAMLLHIVNIGVPDLVPLLERMRGHLAVIVGMKTDAANELCFRQQQRDLRTVAQTAMKQQEAP